MTSTATIQFPLRDAIREGDARFRLVKNSVKPGVVGALETGFQSVSDGPILVVMGDLSDDLTKVDEMVALYDRGGQLVAASRYMPGGKVVGGPFLRRNLSKWAGLTLHWLRGLPTCDATNSFKLYDAKMLNALNLQSSGGFEISLEITVKAFLAGYNIRKLAKHLARPHPRTISLSFVALAAPLSALAKH